MKKLILALVLLSSINSQAYDHKKVNAIFEKAFLKMHSDVLRECSNNEKCVDQVYEKMLMVKAEAAKTKNRGLWIVKYMQNPESSDALFMLAIIQTDEILVDLAGIQRIDVQRQLEPSPEYSANYRKSVARAIFQLALTKRDLLSPVK